MSKKRHILALLRASVFVGESSPLGWREHVTALRKGTVCSLFLKCSANFYPLLMGSVHPLPPPPPPWRFLD